MTPPRGAETAVLFSLRSQQAAWGDLRGSQTPENHSANSLSCQVSCWLQFAWAKEENEGFNMFSQTHTGLGRVAGDLAHSSRAFQHGRRVGGVHCVHWCLQRHFCVALLGQEAELLGEGTRVAFWEEVAETSPRPPWGCGSFSGVWVT